MKLWIATAFDAVYGNGGWAYVRADAQGLTGKAGGERRTTAGALGPLAIAAALADADMKAPLTLYAAPALAAALSALPGWAAAGWRTEDSEPVPYRAQWEPLLPRLGARPLTVLPAPAGADTPTAFCAAWAELGRDKAKATGKAFASAIPKPNLAKVRGL